MNIGLVILNAEPQRGGAERYTQDLAEALAQRGHEVHLLASRFARNVEPARQVHLNGAVGGRVGRCRAFATSLQEHLRSRSYDVVHAMLPVPGCDLYHPHAGIEAENLERGHLRHSGAVRQVISRLSNQLNRKRRLYAGMEQQILEDEGTTLLCLSYAMQQIAERHYKLGEDQSHVLINGVDLHRYDPAGRDRARRQAREQHKIAPDDVVALLMANNYRLKGLKQAMVTLQRLVAAGQKRAKLMVVGREPVDHYRKLAGQLAIGDRVIFAGPSDDPASCYAACDLFVLPTAYDSCSLVVLEALAMGLPVITTRRNGASEAMQDGVEGFVVDNQADLEGLTEAWAALLNDALRMKMSEAALALRPELSKDRHVDHLVEIYRQVIIRRANRKK